MRAPRLVIWGVRPVPASRAVLPVFAAGVRYGEGVFETVGAELGAPFLWSAHVTRMEAAMAALGFPPARLPVEAAVRQLLAGERLAGPAAVRVVALRDGRRTRVAAWAEPFRPPRRARRAGVSLHPLSLPAGPLAGLKSTSYLPHRWALAKARRAGADAALLVDAGGAVREGDHANLFVARAGLVLTPPAPARCLPGVVRRWCIDALGAEGVAVLERDLGLEEVEAADEAWLTSSLAGVVPVRLVGDRPLPGRGRLVALLEGRGVPAPGYAAVPSSPGPASSPS